MYKFWIDYFLTRRTQKCYICHQSFLFNICCVFLRSTIPIFWKDSWKPTYKTGPNQVKFKSTQKLPIFIGIIVRINCEYKICICAVYLMHSCILKSVLTNEGNKDGQWYQKYPHFNEVFGNIFQRVILIESLIINDVIKL